MIKKRIEYELVFNTIKYLISNNKTKEELFNICEYALGMNPTEINYVKKELSKVLPVGEYVVSLNESIIEAYEKIPYYLAHFEYLKVFDIEDLLIKLEQFSLKCSEKDKLYNHYIYMLSILNTLDYKLNKFDQKYYIAQFLYNLLCYEQNIELVENLNQLILDCFKDHSINLFSDNEMVLRVLYLNDIYSIKDMINSRNGLKILLICQDAIKAKEVLTIYSKTRKDQLSTEFDEIFYRLTPREEKCFRIRYGIDDGKPKTLEAVGNIFNVTRERIRQICTKAENRLIDIIKPDYFYYKVLYDTFKKDKKYFFCLDNIDYFENEQHNRIFLTILKLLDICQVEETLNLAYDFDITYDEILDEIIDSKPRIITQEEFNLENKSLQYIIKSEYDFTGEVYFKKGRSIAKVLKEILSMKFNHVIDLKNDDIDKVKELFKKEYYMDIDITNIHSFKAALDRIDYYPIGDSRFMDFEEFVIIPDELLTTIVDYLYEINSPILYSKLFEKFKEELNNCGINNSEYFKSVIDLKIMEDFNLSKSYITPKNSTHSAVQTAVNTIRSFHEVFDWRDIKEKLTLYSDNSLHVILGKEYDNGLLHLNNKKYVYIKNANINDEIKTELKTIIKQHLEDNEGFASIKNIYVDIYYNYEELYQKLGIFQDSFNLFSLCRELYKHEFNFKRPLIFNKNVEKMNVYELIIKKLSSLKEISFDDIKNENYSLGTSVTGHNRIELSELISGTFILVDENKFINRNFYEFNSMIISEVKTILNLIIKREKEIDTRSFKGYNLLPRFKYQWNKFLLLGVIHGYLSDEYEVINQSDTRSIEFIVRRLLHE